jgi:hypothetical protein
MNAYEKYKSDFGINSPAVVTDIGAMVLATSRENKDLKDKVLKLTMLVGFSGFCIYNVTVGKDIYSENRHVLTGKVTCEDALEKLTYVLLAQLYGLDKEYEKLVEKHKSAWFFKKKKKNEKRVMENKLRELFGLPPLGN